MTATTQRQRYRSTSIPAILEYRGLPLAWLGRRMGFTSTYVGMVCRGKRAITEPFVRAACYALDLPAEVLFGGEADQTGGASCDGAARGARPEAGASN